MSPPCRSGRWRAWRFMGCSAAIPCSARGLPRSVGAAQDRVQSGLHPEIAMSGQEFVHRDPASFLTVTVVYDVVTDGCEPQGRFIYAINARIHPIQTVRSAR